MSETKKGNQLHQLLAVENEKKNIAAQMIAECLKTFKDKQSHFDGETRRYTKTVEESDDLASETKEVVTTVKQRLAYTNKFIVDAMNVSLSKEETNSAGTATAELKIGETSFGTFSATSLLQLENQLKVLRALYHNIPTLDPVKQWKFNTQKNMFETDVETSFRTIKEPKVIILHVPTKEHPAQTQLIEVAKQVGQWDKAFQSGRVTPKQKSEMLENVDKLLNATKRARSIANNATVTPVAVGKKLIDFINEPIK